MPHCYFVSGETLWIWSPMTFSLLPEEGEALIGRDRFRDGCVYMRAPIRDEGG